MSAPLALVCDDSESIRHLHRVMLEGVGYDVHECGSGRDALAAAMGKGKGPKRHWALIVLDNDMGDDTSGMDVLRSVREERLAARVAIVSGQQLRSPARLLAAEFFQKPNHGEGLRAWASSVYGEMVPCKVR